MKLTEIHMQTHAPDALAHFYEQLLELPTLQHADGTVQVTTGTSNLYFHPISNGTQPFYHFAINIPNNQFEEAYSWLKARADLLTHAGKDWINFERINADSVYCYDPAGNIVELIARHDLPNASTAPFGPESFLEMSEMGLPVSDVETYVQHLCSSTGMNVWKLSSINDTLTFVGDAHGMLIIVVENRDWLMTNKPAAAFPAEVLIDGHGTDFFDAQRNYRVRFTNP